MMDARIDRSCSLWMGDIDPDMDQSYILAAFRLTGERAVSVRMIQDKQTGGQARYCFVTFDTPEEANNAMLRLNGKPLPQCYDGTRRFKLNSSSNQKSAIPVQEYSIFVGDLSEDIDDLTLYQCFAARYPSVKGAKVVLDTNGSRGYGFVRFTDEAEQLRALKEMDRTAFMGGNPIKVSQATAKKPTTPTVAPAGTTPNPSTYGYGMGYDYSAYANMNAYYGYNTGYPQDYSQYQDMSSYNQAAAAWQSNAAAWQSGAAAQVIENEDDDEPVDPNDSTDIESMNEQCIKQSEEFYIALEDSRWHPLDNVYASVTEVH